VNQTQVLNILPQRLVICRLDASEPLPGWAQNGSFFSITRTADELSIVCEEGLNPSDILYESGWRALMLEGPFDFDQIGVLKSVLDALAGAKISIFAISTFETDYVLVRAADLEKAVTALRSAGHRVC
jgi:hypothetical protein